jgi:hypothetical protein
VDRLGKIIPSIYSIIGTMYKEPRTIEESLVAWYTPPLLVVYPL